MLPVIDALTTSVCPARSAAIAMINSAAVPEGGVEKTAQGRSGSSREVFGGGADQPRRRHERNGRAHENPDRDARMPSQPQADRGRQQQNVQPASGNAPQYLRPRRWHGPHYRSRPFGIGP